MSYDENRISNLIEGGFQHKDELYSLIDRLQKCSEINHPERPWNPAFYNECAFAWKFKIAELRERVEKLESELLTPKTITNGTE